ncbi:MAG: HU family DNA-binding protein [Oscillospiraceae bacterium]|nr:HU family DNA-binding protein [Oscillospiraceae bacterium]
MTKTDLIKAVAETAAFSKKDSEKAVNAVIDSITAALVAGDKVQITGFGTFEVRERKAKEAINPRDPKGAKIKIAAKKAPAFKAGKGLKDAVAK